MENKTFVPFVGSLGVNGFLKLGQIYTGTYRKVKKEKLVFFGNEEKILMMNPHATLPKKLKRRLKDGDEIKVRIDFIFCSGGMNAEIVL